MSENALISYTDDDGEETTLTIEAWEDDGYCYATLDTEDTTQSISLEVSGNQLRNIIKKCQEALTMIEDVEKRKLAEWNALSTKQAS